jgi:uncharacterized protein (TIGR02757 family)
MNDLMPGLESLYRAFNRRSFVHPDPLEFLFRYSDSRDQEIAGIVAATLAYGRVNQILSSVARVLDGMERPRAFLDRTPAPQLRRLFRDFRHRFTDGRELAALLIGVKRAVAEHGSLEALFARGMAARDGTILPGLALFVERLRKFAGGPDACPSLLSSPEDGSACKRLNLYLRWMVRRDAVDPGPWRSVPQAKLVVPLDTHLFRLSRLMGLTRRNQPDLKTALEVTRAFAAASPRDPVRYDFALTRIGINPACGESEIARLLGLRRPPFQCAPRTP